MANTKATSSEQEYPSKNVMVEGKNLALTTWFPPIIQDLYQRSEYNRQLLDPILEQLRQVNTQLQLDVGEGECPCCSTETLLQPLTLYRTEEKVIITTGNVIIVVKVKNYRCPKCGYRQESRADLTLPNGWYDRGLVLTAAAIHTCGCSLADTRGLLVSTFGITPAASTIQNWKNKIGTLAHQLNREALSQVMVEEIQIDELFIALRDGKTKGQHTPVFATGVMESRHGAFLHIGVSYGAQTNRVIVEANLKKIIHHEPAKVTGDGCPSYPGAVAQELPDATFTRDLVHETRNVRKKKRMKKQLKTMIKDFQEEIKACWKQSLQIDRQHFIEQLLEAYRDQSKTKEVKKLARRDWEAYRRIESLEAEAYAQNTQEQVELYKHCLHRRLYTAKEAARRARQQQGETGPFVLPLTSCRLEGTFRPIRSRERRSLCHRSMLGFHALLGLFLLYHNMVGTGRGCLYNLLGASIPNPRWNPFIRFPTRQKNQITLSPSLGTPFRQVTTRFRQQHSHQLPQQSLVESLLIPDQMSTRPLEVPMFT